MPVSTNTPASPSSRFTAPPAHRLRHHRHAATGKVIADLYTPSLTIEDGAFFQGSCAMERPAALKRPGLPQSGLEGSKKVARMPVAKR